MNYGVSVEEYNERIEKQNNLCAICHTEDTERALSVDHDHKTGKIRGLLCKSCNLGIGNLKENSKILQSAILYLEENNE